MSSAPAGSLHGFIQGWLRFFWLQLQAGSVMCGCFRWVSLSSAPAGSLHGFIQGGPSFQGWLAALLGCIPWLVSMVCCWFLHVYLSSLSLCSWLAVCPAGSLQLLGLMSPAWFVSPGVHAVSSDWSAQFGFVLHLRFCAVPLGQQLRLRVFGLDGFPEYRLFMLCFNWF